MIGFATLTFSYDPDGQSSFPSTVWITEMKTQNLQGMDFCQNKYGAFTLIYRELNLKSHQILCVLGAFIRINHIPLSRSS